MSNQISIKEIISIIHDIAINANANLHVLGGFNTSKLSKAVEQLRKWDEIVDGQIKELEQILHENSETQESIKDNGAGMLYSMKWIRQLFDGKEK